MKIVIIGGTGLIGSKTVDRLRRQGHEVVAASQNTGVKATDDPRTVIADPHARYFGTELGDRSLIPCDHPRIGATRFEDWFSHASLQPH